MMPSKRKKPASEASAGKCLEGQAAPPPAAALSFLKETRGSPSWRAQDMAKSLNVSVAVARQVIPFLQAQGYIEASDGGGWLTTASGDAVSGSRPPRFNVEAVEAALSALAGRIKAADQDASARFRVAKAVAFGDFLSGRARVQASGCSYRLGDRQAARRAPQSRRRRSASSCEG
jgi:hypothetical protein